MSSSVSASGMSRIMVHVENMLSHTHSTAARACMPHSSTSSVGVEINTDGSDAVCPMS